jgi:hypothetical protein
VILHSVFDLLAIVTAAAVFYFLPPPQSSVGRPWRLRPAYVSFASLGMITGALVAGTGNLLLNGFSEIDTSVVGGLTGAIVAIEILKRLGGNCGRLRCGREIDSGVDSDRWDRVRVRLNATRVPSFCRNWIAGPPLPLQT